MANDTRADALDLGAIGLESTVTNDRIGFREDGKRERNDYYKFTLDQESDFNLTLDSQDDDANVQILDSDGSVIFNSRKPGKRREIIDADLEAGEYFVRVFPKGGAQTDYRLSMSADPIIGGEDDKAPGTPLGVLNDLAEPVVINDEIGFTRGGQRDTNDYFSFTLSEDSDVSLNLDQLRRNAQVEILDADGETKLLQSFNPGRNEENIDAVLEKGNYVVRVFPQRAAKTKYRLGLSADEVPDSGKLPGTPVGDLTATEDPFFIIEDIGFGRGTRRNQNDYYSFSIGEDASFYAELDQLKANANLQLYEYNATREKLGSLLVNSRTKGRRPEIISEFLEAGDYAVRVRPQGSAKTDYRVELDAQADIDDFPTLETAEDLGELTETPTNRSNDIGILKGDRFRDEADWFKFNLSEEKNVDLTLGELRANADVEIYDSEGERLYKSSKKRRAQETINETFDAGTYYVKVFPRGNARTDYRLSLSAGEGEEIRQTFPLGTLASPTKYSNNDDIGRERSGTRNELDEYTFTLSESTDFSATLDQIKQNANLELYNGSNLVASSTERGRQGELIGEVLEPGNYSLRVVPVGNAETRYRIGIETESAGVGDEFFEVGALTEYKNKDRIGFTNKGTRNGNDYYNFSLGGDSDINITLDELRGDVNIAIRAGDKDGDIVLSSFNPGRASEFINGTLDAGNYSLQVFPTGNAKSNYFVTMNADPVTGGGSSDDGDDGTDDGVDPITGEDLDGTMAGATDLGTSLTPQSGSIGFTEDGVEDASDYYKFSLAAADDVQIILGDLKQNADLELLDGSGTVIASANGTGSDMDTIAQSLDAGDYFLRVAAVGSAQTDYTVQFF